jgi:hypothetical protein
MTLTDLQFLLKLLVSSLLIALVIKFLAPMLPIPATTASAVVMVVTPALGLGAFLLLRPPSA